MPIFKEKMEIMNTANLYLPFYWISIMSWWPTPTLGRFRPRGVPFFSRSQNRYGGPGKWIIFVRFYLPIQTQKLIKELRFTPFSGYNLFFTKTCVIQSVCFTHQIQFSSTFVPHIFSLNRTALHCRHLETFPIRHHFLSGFPCMTFLADQRGISSKEFSWFLVNFLRVWLMIDNLRYS